MSEADAVFATPAPRTRATLLADLKRLGVKAGDTLLVHCSLSSLGWVCGSTQTVLYALIDAIGPTGNLVMPAHSTQLSDPELWIDPKVPASWHQEIRASLPAFDPLTTGTRGMGAVAEHFRTWPGVIRSYHPQLSFCALGPEAQSLTENQPLSLGMGEFSPLAKLYDHNAKVLMLGTSWDTCTCFHLAEYRLGRREICYYGAPLMQEGHRRWIEFYDIDSDMESFEVIGKKWELTGMTRLGKVGSADSRLFDLQSAVDFAQVFWASQPL